MTVACPLDCEFLRDARTFEKTLEREEQAPNLDIRLTEKYLEEHQELIMFLGSLITMGWIRNDGAIDYDVREGLAALVQTYRTLQSGVYYEGIPANPLAAGIYRSVQDGMAEARAAEQQEFGSAKTRDADVLGALLFLQRLEYQHNNGRKRGRAFIQFLHEFYTDAPPAEAAPPTSLILP